MIKIAITFLCALCLLGCRPQFAPLVSGTVTDGGVVLGKAVAHEGEPSRTWSLSQRQLEGLSSWLKLHRSEWRTILASPPLPSYSIQLIHSDGAYTQIDLFSVNESWQHTAHVYSYDRNGKFIFGGSMNLQSQDTSSLKLLLSKEK